MEGTDKRNETVAVCLLEDSRIEFELHGEFSKIVAASGDTIYEPLTEKSYFEIDGVRIGKEFHWDHRERGRYNGKLLIRKSGNDCMQAINILPTEDYIASVISSEMSGDSPTELLKAHAVISRSWLKVRQRFRPANTEKQIDTPEERIRWYDNDGHEGYDVCADDHCQRYYGISEALKPSAIAAVRATWGEVLEYNGKTYDARFSKCCGGAFEKFSSCWGDEYNPADSIVGGRDIGEKSEMPDLTKEEEAKEWIKGSPDAFCNSRNRELQLRSLNKVDLATSDYYRWKTEYTQKEISQIIKEKTGIDFGKIESLSAIERGISGRIIKLRITGSRHTMTIGKELEIRRCLSKTHLYSSAFTVDTEGRTESGEPAKFTLHGAGWGHGVGLCQTGAAVMAAKGYDYRQILQHYYPGTEIIQV